MTIRREKTTLVIDYGGNEAGKRLFDLEVRDSTVMVLPTRKRTAYVYGFNVFSELTTARHLRSIMYALEVVEAQGNSVYISSQARTIFKRIKDLRRLEDEIYLNRKRVLV
jgi:hypothetical protein